MTLRVGRYEWVGGAEAMLRFGPDHGPTLLCAAPLFEEANRTRAAIMDVLRSLAARGIASALPDLPGTGESLLPTPEATLAGWRQAFAAAARALPGPVRVMAWRGGALVTAEMAAPRWHLSPLSGAEVMRDLRRTRGAGETQLYAGNDLSGELVAELESAAPPAATRTVRLDTDPRPADLKLPGRPLWRAAEPGTDAALQTAIIDDLACWIAACAS
jgi:pimeloyl-ACP methyl ester carboxylesterase